MGSDYTGIWKLFYDWQTIIAGGLALFAGVLTYQAGWKGARAVEKQNDILKRSARSASAREILVAARIFDGILASVAANIEATVQIVRDSPMDAFSGKASPRENLRLPPLLGVLDQLGKLNHETVGRYFLLCSCIDHFTADKIPDNPKETCQKLGSINEFITDLRKEISECRRLAQKTVVNTEEQKA